MSDATLQTEFEFTLPQGYVDSDGTLHSEGRMRLATAADEIEPLQDPRVQSNASYMTIILLSRVVTQLGTLESVNPTIIENLFVSDLEHLQVLYERINSQGSNTVSTACPECGEEFDVSAKTGAVSESSTKDASIGMGTTGMDNTVMDAAGMDQEAPGAPDTEGGSGNSVK